MASIADREKITNRIKNLLNKTEQNGCTEAEALSAADLAHSLLRQYDLTLSDLDISSSTCVLEQVDSGYIYVNIRDLLLKHLAGFTEVKIWFNTVQFARKKTRYVVFFGMPSDVQVAKYLYNLITSSLEFELRKFHASALFQDLRMSTTSNQVTKAFIRGFIHRIGERLTSMKQATDTALRVSTALVVRKETQVNTEFDKIGITITPGRNIKYTSNIKSFHAGFRSGNNAPLHVGKISE